MKDSRDTHFRWSIFKSAIRFVACAFLFVGIIPLAATCFAAAEVIGIIEEL